MEKQIILRKDYYYFKKGQIINVIARHRVSVECEIFGIVPEKGYQVSKNGYQISFIRNDIFEILKNNYSALKVLIACEESQTVCKEFRKLGHEAFRSFGWIKTVGHESYKSYPYKFSSSALYHDEYYKSKEKLKSLGIQPTGAGSVYDYECKGIFDIKPHIAQLVIYLKTLL